MSPVSGAVWPRAETRNPWQNFGSHMNEPPRVTFSLSAAGVNGWSRAGYGRYQSWHHCQTFPPMSVSPDGMTPNAPTGEVYRYPSSTVLRLGKVPCQVFAW